MKIKTIDDKTLTIKTTIELSEEDFKEFIQDNYYLFTKKQEVKK